MSLDKEPEYITKIREAREYLKERENQRDCINSAVKHPKHYQGINGLEVFTVMENFIPKYENSFDGYIAGNVLKYVLRAPSKGKMLEDLKKAKEHLDLLIERLED